MPFRELKTVIRRPVVLAVAIATVLGVAAAQRVPARAASAPARSSRVEVGAPAIPLLTHLERHALARRHAPELRFNAWFAKADASSQHVNEDYFPASADRFLADLAQGEATVVVRSSRGPEPALTQRVRFARGPHFGDRAIERYPARMVGEAPGDAPIYADVYPDADDPTVYFAEYWSFYAYDQSDAQIARTVRGIGGHRSDWEHISLKLRVSRGAETSSIEGAVYYGHEHALFVEPRQLEVVGGTHPVVYVGQGKHASYPQAGEWRDYLGLAPLVDMDDVFHGNGVRIETWNAEVVDIARAAPARPQWLDWRGYWGPDLTELFGKPVARSARGPWFHRESNDRFAGVTGTWTDVKATRPGLRCDRDTGLVAPRIDPAPLPRPILPARDS